MTTSKQPDPLPLTLPAGTLFRYDDAVWVAQETMRLDERNLFYLGWVTARDGTNSDTKAQVRLVDWSSVVTPPGRCAVLQGAQVTPQSPPQVDVDELERVADRSRCSDADQWAYSDLHTLLSPSMLTALIAEVRALRKEAEVSRSVVWGEGYDAALADIGQKSGWEPILYDRERTANPYGEIIPAPPSNDKPPEAP